MKLLVNLIVIITAMLLAALLVYTKLANPGTSSSMGVEALQYVSLSLSFVLGLHVLANWVEDLFFTRKTDPREGPLEVPAGPNQYYDHYKGLADRWHELDNILAKEHWARGEVEIVVMLTGRQTAIKVDGSNLSGAAAAIKNHIEQLEKADELARAVDAHNQSKDLYTKMHGGGA